MNKCSWLIKRWMGGAQSTTLFFSCSPHRRKEGISVLLTAQLCQVIGSRLLVMKQSRGNSLQFVISSEQQHLTSYLVHRPQCPKLFYLFVRVWTGNQNEQLLLPKNRYNHHIIRTGFVPKPSMASNQLRSSGLHLPTSSKIITSASWPLFVLKFLNCHSCNPLLIMDTLCQINIYI